MFGGFYPRDGSGRKRLRSDNMLTGLRVSRVTSYARSKDKDSLDGFLHEAVCCRFSPLLPRRAVIAEFGIRNSARS